MTTTEVEKLKLELNAADKGFILLDQLRMLMNEFLKEITSGAEDKKLQYLSDLYEVIIVQCRDKLHHVENIISKPEDTTKHLYAFTLKNLFHDAECASNGFFRLIDLFDVIKSITEDIYVDNDDERLDILNKSIQEVASYYHLFSLVVLEAITLEIERLEFTMEQVETKTPK